MGAPKANVDARPVAHRIRTLRNAGFTFERITEITGVHRRSAQMLLSGKTKTYPPDSYARVMSIDIHKVIREELPSNGRLPAAKYRDLLRQLGANGWPRHELDRRLGIGLGEENIWRERAKYVQPDLAMRIQKVYDDIGGKVGPSTPSARVYRKLGYLPPLAYADDGTPIPEAALPLPPLVRCAS
jgi:hypothetical protein